MSLLSGVPEGWTEPDFLRGQGTVYTGEVLDTWQIDPQKRDQGPEWFQTMYRTARNLYKMANPTAAVARVWVRRVINVDGVATIAADGKVTQRNGCAVALRRDRSPDGVLFVTPRLLRNDFSTRLDLLEEVLHAMFRQVSLAQVARLPVAMRPAARTLHGRQFLGDSPPPTMRWLPFNCHRDIYGLQKNYVEDQLKLVACGQWHASDGFPEAPDRREPIRFDNMMKRLDPMCHYRRDHGTTKICPCDAEYQP